MRRRTLLKLVALFVALTVVAGACGSDGDGGGDVTDGAVAPTETTAAGHGMAGSSCGSGNGGATSATTGAATLRADLTGLLGEHVYLAALATGAALRGDSEGFEASAAALNGPADSNTADLVAAVTSAYGAETGRAFDALWRSQGHIPALIAYAEGLAANDQARSDAAAADLTAYATTVATTLNAFNGELAADAVERMVLVHVTDLKAVVDAQKAGDQPKEHGSLRVAYAHMGELATALAAATARRFPATFDGDPESRGADLRAALTSLLREHVLLASSATGAALAGRTPQFEAAAAALNGPTGSNTADLVAAVRNVYGDQVGRAFDGLWRSEGHIPSVVAYAQAVAVNDRARADKALADLLAYATTFATTMSSVNPNLAAPTVEEAVRVHATTLQAVVDSQKAGDAGAAASLLRTAVAHMSTTAATLASATVRQHPDRF